MATSAVHAVAFCRVSAGRQLRQTSPAAEIAGAGAPAGDECGRSLRLKWGDKDGAMTQSRNARCKPRLSLAISTSTTIRPERRPGIPDDSRRHRRKRRGCRSLRGCGRRRRAGAASERRTRRRCRRAAAARRTRAAGRRRRRGRRNRLTERVRGVRDGHGIPVLVAAGCPEGDAAGGDRRRPGADAVEKRGAVGGVDLVDDRTRGCSISIFDAIPSICPACGRDAGEIVEAEAGVRLAR